MPFDYCKENYVVGTNMATTNYVNTPLTIQIMKPPCKDCFLWKIFQKYYITKIYTWFNYQVQSLIKKLFIYIQNRWIRCPWRLERRRNMDHLPECYSILLIFLFQRIKSIFLEQKFSNLSPLNPMLRLFYTGIADY